MMPLQAARRRPEVAVGLLAAATLAWWLTVRRMTGMDAAPGADLGALGWFTGTWVVMMAAMMLPSFAPRLAEYAALTRGRRPSRMLLFSGGYLLAWAVAGLAAYALFELGKGALAGELAWHGGGRWLSGGLLALAAVYELTPLKRAYLTRCREQLGHMGRLTSEGRSAALALGVRNGGWCIGCSWALMAALFALGVMSLTWMALVAVLIAVEKTAPRPRAARLATAAVLAVLAAGVLAAPQHVPGLVLPDSGGMHAMKAMGS
jgi:predicted metal-binding membrane protein